MWIRFFRGKPEETLKKIPMTEAQCFKNYLWSSVQHQQKPDLSCPLCSGCGLSSRAVRCFSEPEEEKSTKRKSQQAVVTWSVCVVLLLQLLTLCLKNLYNWNRLVSSFIKVSFVSTFSFLPPAGCIHKEQTMKNRYLDFFYSVLLSVDLHCLLHNQ